MQQSAEMMFASRVKLPKEKIIYVSSSRVDRQLAKKLMRRMESGKFIIAIDWTVNDSGDTMRYCMECKDGIERSKMLVVLNSDAPTSGKWWECGMAAMANVPILAFGKPVSKVFRHLLYGFYDIDINDTEIIFSVICRDWEEIYG